LFQGLNPDLDSFHKPDPDQNRLDPQHWTRVPVSPDKDLQRRKRWQRFIFENKRLKKCKDKVQAEKKAELFVNNCITEKSFHMTRPA
jgi:hypothetical protein